MAAQTAAVIKSTGGAANVSAKEIDSLANSILRKTGIDDEAIKTGENMLLTFTNVRNEVGKNNDIFTQATRAAVDMDTAMTQGNVTAESLAKTNLRLGRALNDPIRGVSALRRVGVQFTKAQEEQIKKLVESGKTMEAQKLILRELNREFGGSAEAVGKTLPMRLKFLREWLRNVGADALEFAFKLGTPVSRALGDVWGWIQKIADAPSLKVALDIGGKGIIDLGKRIKTQVESALAGTDWRSIGRQLGQAIGSAIVFTDAQLSRGIASLIGAIRAHAQDFAELGAEIAARMVGTLMDPAFWARHIDLLAVLITARFGGALFGKLAQVGVRAATRLLAGIGGTIASRLGPLITGLFSRVPSWIATPFAAAAKAAWGALQFVVRTLRNDLRAVLGQIPGWIKAAFKIGAVISFIGWVQKGIDKVRDLWNWLKDVASKAWNVVVKVSVKLPTGGIGLPNVGIPDPRRLIRPRAMGGFIPMIPGAARGKDSVPALLTPGEVVLNRAQQAAFGGPQVFKEMFGFAGGGIAGKKKPKHKPPRLPASIKRAEARAAGTETVDDDIAAIQQEASWIDRELARKDLTRSERESLQVRKIRVRNKLKSLKARRKKQRARERTDLPKAIQLRIATARSNDDDKALLAALKEAERWYVRQLAKAKTIDAKIALTEALDGVREEIKSLEEAMREGEAEQPEESEDLRAQLEQANERLRVAQRSADLANAFVATGIFAGGGGGRGGGRVPQIVIQSLVMPTDAMLRHAARAVSEGLGSQGFRPATTYRSGV